MARVGASISRKDTFGWTWVAMLIRMTAWRSTVGKFTRLSRDTIVWLVQKCRQCWVFATVSWEFILVIQPWRPPPRNSHKAFIYSEDKNEAHLRVPWKTSWWFQICLFSSLFGEDSHLYFSNGLTKKYPSSHHEFASPIFWKPLASVVMKNSMRPTSRCCFSLKKNAHGNPTGGVFDF